MSVLILKQGSTLIASVQADQTDRDLERLQTELAHSVGEQRSRGVIIDVTAMDVVDSYAARTLRSIAQTAQLRGAQTVVVGIQPAVAIAMVELGVVLSDVATALDLEEGLELLGRDIEPRD